jgi:hypothetical protein
MANCGVYEGQKFTLCLGSVIQNLLADVREAQHYLVLVVRFVFDHRLFELEESKFRNELLLDAAHTSQVFNQIFQVIACFLICHVCEVLPSQLFVESKDFAAELLGFESRNLSK